MMRHTSLLPGQYDALGYKAATYARENIGLSSGGTADYHSRYDRELLINLSRQLDRDNWLYEGIINRWCDYVLGASGFTLQAQTSDPDLNRRIEDDLWPGFWRNPELRGQMNFRDVEEINLRELAVAGDTLWLKMGDEAGDQDRGKLQHVEAERITSTARSSGDELIEQGVRLNKSGQHLGYYVADVDPYGWVRASSGKFVPARDAIFVPSRFKRSSQTRHMPVLVSSMPLSHRIEDILTSEAVAWQVLSRLVATLKRATHSIRPTFKGATNATDKGASSGEAVKLITDVGMAILFQANEKDQLEVVQQNRPSQQFEQSLKLFIRLFGVPLGIPLEVILLDWHDMNYSSARAALLQAFVSFRRWQQLDVERFYSPVYRWKVGRWIAEGALPWRPDIWNHTWDVPGWPWIDEDKEVSAWAKKIDRAIATQTEALASLGKDRAEQQEIRKQEILAAWQIAMEIQEATEGGIQADKIWRHFAGLETGKTEQAVLAGVQAAPANPVEEH